MTDEILEEVRDGVLWVTFNRPQARNAFTFAMYDRLEAICGAVSGDGPVRAVVMTGAGDRAFGAGTDIAAFRAFEGPDDAVAYEARADRVMAAIEGCPVPTIAAIGGACTGGAAMIAACCDLRLASPALKYGFPIARTLGNALSAPNLRRLVALFGTARVQAMLLAARLMEAEEAKACGFVIEVLPDHAALLARAEALAQTVAGLAPLTLRATKEILRRLRDGEPDPDDDPVTRCYTSDDFREGLEAFLAKRPPRWRGR
ncbi:MAG: enoyl-CoA hydratase/isomerase family protein [Geminicoccaceae bacterium]|nr:enoyl-CoA hydratase/isomerase family protein [Geminicoccaceae bacterium]